MVRTISRWQRFTDKETDILYSALLNYSKQLDKFTQLTAYETVERMISELIDMPRQEVK